MSWLQGSVPKGSRTEGEKGREKREEGQRDIEKRCGTGSQKTGCCKQERDEEQDNCVDRGEWRDCAKKQGQRDGGINKRDREQEREAEGTGRTRQQRKDKGQGKILQ